MTNIIKKVTDAYNTALSSIEREKKIQELTSALGNKLTATQRAVIAKDFNYMQGVHSNLLEQTKKSNPMLTQYSEG